MTRRQMISAFVVLIGFILFHGIERPALSQNPNTAPENAVIINAEDTVKQGNVLSVVIRNAKGYLNQGKLKLGKKTVPLFLQNTGDYVGLVPVDVYESTGNKTLMVMDSRGQVIYSQPVTVQSGKFPTQNISVSKATKGLEPLPGEMEAIGKLKNTLTSTRLWEEPFVSPTPDCMNSPFGVRRLHNGKDTGNYHKGIDQRSPHGRPIKAIANGTVQISKMYRLHGGTTGLDHGQGITSIYIHLSKLAKSEGDPVTKGETIGYVGSTGFATGPHLHWGLYVNGLPVNPMQWVTKTPICGQ
jgi:murein DD-endopeptidase MepM/ murein hydrolase activator NlpD